jgi:hypothetical protein
MSSVPTETSPSRDEVLDDVYRRARRIRDRRNRVLAGFAAIPLAVVIVLVVVVVASDDETARVVTDRGEDVVPAPASVIYARAFSDDPAIVQIDLATMTVRTTFAVPQLPTSTIPAHELPALPPGVEGPLVTGGSSPEKLRLSPDGSRLYFQIRGGSCGDEVYAVDVNDATAMTRVLDAPSDRGIGDFTPTADDRIVWYRCAPPGSVGGAIVITDLEAGSERSVDYDERQGIPYLAVSPDGRTMAIERSPSEPPGRAEIRVVPIDGTTSIEDAPILQPVDGCDYAMPQFDRGSGSLYALEQCGPVPRQGGRLVAIDIETGSITRTVLEFDDETALNDYSVDATGEHLLYSVSVATNPAGLVSDGAEPRTFRSDGGQPPERLQLLPLAMSPGFRSDPNLVW